MITGVVSADGEATISVRVMSPAGREHEVTGVIDTGFNGHLTLPADVINHLDLSFHSATLAMLGDGRQVALSRYEASVQWDGRRLEVMVLEADGGPLIGMSLLNGHRLTIEVVTGGSVIIETLGE